MGGLLKRFVRLVWGDTVEPELRPLLAVALFGSLSASSVWTFIGIWAIDKLGVDSSALAVALLFGACLAATSGYVAGHVSDHVGRRPVILAGWATLSAYVWLFVLSGNAGNLGLVVLAGAGAAGSIGWAATQAIVADLQPGDGDLLPATAHPQGGARPGRHEARRRGAAVGALTLRIAYTRRFAPALARL